MQKLNEKRKSTFHLFIIQCFLSANVPQDKMMLLASKTKLMKSQRDNSVWILRCQKGKQTSNLWRFIIMKTHDQISSDLLVQIIICKNIFPENKNRPLCLLHSKKIWRTSYMETLRIHVTTMLSTHARCWLACHNHSAGFTLSRVDRVSVGRSTAACAKRVSTVIAVMSWNIWDTSFSWFLSLMEDFHQCAYGLLRSCEVTPFQALSVLLICWAAAGVVLEPTSQHVAMCAPPPFNLPGTWRRGNQQHRTAHVVLHQMIWKQWERRCMKHLLRQTFRFATLFRFILFPHRARTNEFTIGLQM